MVLALDLALELALRIVPYAALQSTLGMISESSLYSTKNLLEKPEVPDAKKYPITA